MTFSFRHTAGFGKRMEYYLIGQMLMEGLDCYVPVVDDHGVDCVVKKADGTFIEIQIKARSKEVKMGDGALFAGIVHEPRPNYYFVFYSERLEKMWIMSSDEFIVETGGASGAASKSVSFNSYKFDPAVGKHVESPKPRFAKYECTSFARFH